jgi:hypothetical protein
VGGWVDGQGEAEAEATDEDAFIKEVSSRGGSRFERGNLRTFCVFHRQFWRSSFGGGRVG